MGHGIRKDVWPLDAQIQPDAFEQYRRGCAHLFDVTLQSPQDTFFNSLEGYHLGAVVFARCRGVPQRFERKPSHILIDGADSVMVVLELEGGDWSGDYDGRHAAGRSGQIRLVDMARPFDMSTEAYASLYVMTPRAQLEGCGDLDFHGLVVSEDSPSGRLLGSHLRTLSEVIDRMAAREADSAAKAIVALIAGAILAHAEPALDDARPVEKMLLASGRRFVEQHLEDVDLSPEAVRRHLGVSRSLLYKVFEPLAPSSRPAASIRRSTPSCRTAPNSIRWARSPIATGSGPTPISAAHSARGSASRPAGCVGSAKRRGAKACRPSNDRTTSGPGCAGSSFFRFAGLLAQTCADRARRRSVRARTPYQLPHSASGIAQRALPSVACTPSRHPTGEHLAGGVQ